MKPSPQTDQQTQWDAEDGLAFRRRLRELQACRQEAEEEERRLRGEYADARAARHEAEQRIRALLEEDQAGMPLFDRAAPTPEPEPTPAPATGLPDGREVIDLRELRGVNPDRLDAARLAPTRYKEGTLRPVTIDHVRYCVTGSVGHADDDPRDESWTLRVLYDVENYEVMYGGTWPLKNAPGPESGVEYYTGCRVIQTKKKTLVVGPSCEGIVVVKMRASS